MVTVQCIKMMRQVNPPSFLFILIIIIKPLMNHFLGSLWGSVVLVVYVLQNKPCVVSAQPIVAQKKPNARYGKHRRWQNITV